MCRRGKYTYEGLRVKVSTGISPRALTNQNVHNREKEARKSLLTFTLNPSYIGMKFHIFGGAPCHLVRVYGNL